MNRNGGVPVESTARRTVSGAVAVVAAVIALAGLGLAERAQAEFGDEFGFARDVAGTAFPGDRALWAGTCDMSQPSTGSGGFGPAPDPIADPVAHCMDHGGLNPALEVEPTWLSPPAWRLDPEAQAASHPDATTSFWMRRSDQVANVSVASDGDARNIVIELPPGVAADPTAVPFCPSEDLRTQPPTCHPSTQVGVVTLTLSNNTPVIAAYPIYNAEPRDGKTAEFLFSAGVAEGQRANVPIVAKVRTDGDFGIDAMVMRIPSVVPLLGQTATLWGVPWAAENDSFRAPAGYNGHAGGGEGGDGRAGMPVSGLDGSEGQEPQSYDPSWGEVRPFFANPSRCGDGPGDLLATSVRMDPWQFPGRWYSHTAWTDVPVDGCENVEFGPEIDFEASSSRADDATGLTADLSFAQKNRLPFETPAAGADPGEVDAYLAAATEYWREGEGSVGTSHLKDTVVRLPEGLSVNPSGAAGLEACSDAEIGLREDGSPPLFNNADPFDGDDSDGAECPGASRIGTASVKSPVLDEVLTGAVVLGEPRSTDPASGEMFRLFLVIRNRQRGLLAKVYGSTVADPATGRLTVTFANNPQLPLESVSLEIKGGSRGILATAPECGESGWQARFTPWSEVAIAERAGELAVDRRCGNGFSPSMRAGMDSHAAGASGSFSLRFDRPDGSSFLAGLEAELPAGLLATIRGVTQCTTAQIEADACRQSSRVGRVDAKAGAGTPFVLERKGEVFFTEGYRGAPFGLAVRVPVVAGPFRGEHELSPIWVRQALHIDPETAQVKAVSDPFPQIHHGIPLRVRQITVRIDRDGFMRNPSNCTPSRVETDLRAADGQLAELSYPFRVDGCTALPFKPRFRMVNLDRGRRATRRSWNPRMRFVLTQGEGQAGIAGARITLPRSIILDQSNIRTVCTRDQFASRSCPEQAIYGHARAFSPLLNRMLEGPVYLGSSTNPLPDLIVDLEGETRIVLRGRIDSVPGGRIRNTFSAVPDAPVSRFALTMFGGKNRGLLVNSADLCQGRNRAVAVFAGQNGRVTADRPKVGFRYRGCKQIRRKQVRQQRVQRKRMQRKQALRDRTQLGRAPR